MTSFKVVSKKSIIFVVFSFVFVLQGCNPAWQVASHRADLEGLKSEIAKGVSPNVQNELGLTPLHHIVMDDPLLYSSGNRAEAVAFLLSAGADPTIKNNYGLSPFGWAVLKNQSWATSQMIRNNNIRNDEGIPNSTPLIEAIFSQNWELANQLIDKPGNLNFVNAKGDTALTWAIVKRNNKITEKLLVAGADPECCSKLGSLLTFAATNLDYSTFKLMLKKGAALKARKSEVSTALIEAVIRQEPQKVKLLIELGADVNERSQKGDTPLMWASVKGSREIVHMLVSKGANINDVNLGQTAARLAMTANNVEIAEYLEPDISENWSPPLKPQANVSTENETSWLAWANILVQAFDSYTKARYGNLEEYHQPSNTSSQYWNNSLQVKTKTLESTLQPLSCSTGLDCSLGNICVKSENSIDRKGMCVKLETGPVFETQQLEVKSCSFDTECSIDAKCIKKKNEIYGVCLK